MLVDMQNLANVHAYTLIIHPLSNVSLQIMHHR